MAKAKNATFLFNRDFMDYHKDRFHDYSLLIFKEGKLIGLMPAAICKTGVCSHQGLSYGGLVLDMNVEFNDVLSCFRELLYFLKQNDIGSLQIKIIPKIYNLLPGDEIDYLLFKTKATLDRRDILSVIDYSRRLKINSKNRKRGLKRATSKNLIVQEQDEFEAFWNKILIPNLRTNHNVSPVHSIEEIIQLKRLFPKNIRQFNVLNGDRIVAGATVFETNNVAHIQYISADTDRQKFGSLDLLFDVLINDVFKDKKFFDFGISNEKQGQKLNLGLLKWKESFGARSVIQDFYTIETKNYIKLDTLGYD